MIKFTLPFVETMITQACNMRCNGCTNYSDIDHRGYTPWSQGQTWFQEWGQRLNLPDIGIMGGEPFINPEWQDWLFGIRKIFPDSQIRFTTNGLLLHKQSDIMSILQKIENIVFKISVHIHSVDLEDWINNFLSSYDWQPVHEHNINRWALPGNIRFQINRPTLFLKPFKNDYADMMPWGSDPGSAFQRCVQKTCPLLYKGEIYKCSTSALLRDTLKRFGNPNLESWMPYTQSGISLDSKDTDIKTFISNFGRAESICGQCPDSSAPAIDHRLEVVVRHQYR